MPDYKGKTVLHYLGVTGVEVMELVRRGLCRFLSLSDWFLLV
jgi:hypothetical protein